MNFQFQSMRSYRICVWRENRLPKWRGWEILLRNDSSPTTSWQVQELAFRYPRITSHRQWLIMFTCYFLRDGYRQVLERNYGVWHTKCFSRSLPPNVSDVEKICHQLPGGRPSDNPLFRLIEFDGKNDSPLISAYGEPTKLIITNKFSELKVNDGITLHIKPSRSLAQPTDWTAEDKRTCYMLEIKC